MEAFLHLRLFVVFMCVLSCMSCTTHLLAPNTVSKPLFYTLSGTVLFPHAIYFPAHDRLEITLNAYNPSNGDKKTIAVQTIRNPKLFPLHFVLRYDPDDVSYFMNYRVFAKLYHEHEEEPYLASKELFLASLADGMDIEITLEPIATHPFSQ